MRGDYAKHLAGIGKLQSDAGKKMLKEVIQNRDSIYAPAIAQLTRMYVASRPTFMDIILRERRMAEGVLLFE